MTHELGPEARALLDAAREGLGPDAAAIRRMRAGIDASIAGGAAGAGAAGGGAAGAGALAAKVGVVAVVAALALGAIVYGRRGEPAIAPAIETRVEPPAARLQITDPTDPGGPAREAAAPGGPAREAAAPGAGEPEIEMAPLVLGQAPRRPPRAPSAAAGAPPPPASASAPAGSRAAPRRADLAREVELVDRAMAALRGGDPAGALAAVRVHVVETAGAGQLAEDAAAIEIEALCRRRDPTVAAKLAAFDARWPESAQRSRLTTRCP